MQIVGLPGEFGLVWATAMVTNIYGAMVVFFNISIQNSYTVAQVTVLALMMLVAHTLPIEVSITKKAGIKFWYMMLLRILCAFLFGLILFNFFDRFSLLQQKNVMIWNPGYQDQSIIFWIYSQIKYYVTIFLIILFLMILMTVLKKTGLIQKLNNLLEPGLEKIGMSKNAAPITVIGTTLGLSYGGGLIIKESKTGQISKKDVFLSLSLMGLTHSLIEDTLLMVAIGASLIGTLFARIFLTIIFMFILIKFINKMKESTFKKYFVD